MGGESNFMLKMMDFVFKRMDFIATPGVPPYAYYTTIYDGIVRCVL